ncbi:MAG: nucleoside deaminase [Bdellovibrionaceae bacterium]|jgi:tRNA(adenine34) deaminase|nr:nucleoside deaminase [Pseudobdellovibrionaceae bacterium]
MDELNSHEHFMQMALKLSQEAAERGEVPIGALIVKDGTIVAQAHNEKEEAQQAIYHAEILVIKRASEALGSWRLTDCTLYVTLEPCAMCAGAIIQSRIKRVVFATRDPKAGAGGSVLNVLENKNLNHQVEIVEGVLEQECSHELKSFFRKLRL